MNVQRSLHLQYHDEVPLSRTPNTQLLPGCRRINGCPLPRVCVLTAVCVHFEWVKCGAQILSMGHHIWLYVCHITLKLQRNSRCRVKTGGKYRERQISCDRNRESVNAGFVNVTSDCRLLLKIIQPLVPFNTKHNPASRVPVVFPLYTTWPISPLHIVSFTSTNLPL